MSHPGLPLRTVATRRLLAAAATAALAMLAATIAAPMPRPVTPWRAFDLIVVPDGTPANRIADRLAPTGRVIIDRSTATIELEEFTGTDPRPVASITARFDEADPRLDPFVRSIDRLFAAEANGRPHQVVYLSRDGRGPVSPLEISRLLQGIRYRLVGAARPTPFVVAAAAFAIMVIAAIAARGRRVAAACATPIIVVAAFAWGVPGLVRAALVGLLWALWLAGGAGRERERLVYGARGNVRDRLGPYDALLAVALALYGGSFALPAADPLPLWRAIVLAIAVPTVLVAISAGAYLFHQRRVAHSEHPFFQPRPILPHRSGRGTPVARAVTVATGVVVLALILVPVVSRTRGTAAGALTIPHPVPIVSLGAGDGGGTALADVFAAATFVDPVRVPLSTGGFIAHRWYQETLMWGGRYGVPREGESVTIHRFARSDEGIDAYLEDMLVADQAWVDSLADASPESAYRLFVEEGGSFEVTGREYRVDAPTSDLLLRVAFAALVAPLALAVVSRLRKARPVGTVLPQRRERQQA